MLYHLSDLLFGFAYYLAENNIFNKSQGGGQTFCTKYKKINGNVKFFRGHQAKTKYLFWTRVVKYTALRFGIKTLQ
jgi:hypothetical protein